MKERVFGNKPFADKKIRKGELSKFVKRNKATKWIAHYFRVSPRTVYRKIREYGLKGLRPKGKKPLPEKPRKITKPRGWVFTWKYIDSLDRQYGFLNIQYPPTKYVNTYTLTCSDHNRNPKGEFTTCTVYYVALESAMYFLYAIQYRLSEEGVSFDEIHHYFSNNAMSMLQLSLESSDIEIVDLVAFHFTYKTEQTEPVIAYTKRFSEKLKQRKTQKGKRSHG